MKHLAIAVAALAFASGAWAQPAAPAPDPVRLNLARQIVAATGGEAQAEAQMKMMFTAVRQGLAQSLPPEESQLQGPIFDLLSQEMVKITPQLLELSTRAWAASYTEKELRDLLAFWTSETGQATVRKAPQVRAEVVAESIPLVLKLLPAIMNKTVERVCESQRCTPKQREAVVNALARAAPGAPS